MFDFFMMSLFKSYNPRFMRILWNIGLFLPIWNIVQTVSFYGLFFINYSVSGNFGEYYPRDTKWAKWLLNEE